MIFSFRVQLVDQNHGTHPSPTADIQMQICTTSNGEMIYIMMLDVAWVSNDDGVLVFRKSRRWKKNIQPSPPPKRLGLEIIFRTRKNQTVCLISTFGIEGMLKVKTTSYYLPPQKMAWQATWIVHAVKLHILDGPPGNSWKPSATTHQCLSWTEGWGFGYVWMGFSWGLDGFGHI